MKPYKEMNKLELLQEIYRIKQLKAPNLIGFRQNKASLERLWKLYHGKEN